MATRGSFAAPGSASCRPPSSHASKAAAQAYYSQCMCLDPSTTPLGSYVRPLFALEPDTTFINHGSFGASPTPVIQAHAQFLGRMESNPERFFRREAKPLLRSALTELASFVGSKPEDIVFVANATTGVNAVLRSLDLQENDEVICLNLAYPAIKKTLQFICYYTQEYVELKVVDVQLPLPSYEDLVAAVDRAITPNTRLAVFDHISSGSGLLLPLEQLIRVCHAKNVPVLVDGAHAPGQIPLNLESLGADYYVGNCYKWLFASKGCAFLWVKKEFQSTTRPVVTGLSHEKGFVEEFLEQGCRDQCAFLSLPTAMAFYRAFGVDRVYAYNSSLVQWATDMLAQTWRTEPLLPPSQRCPFMSSIRLPICIPASLECNEEQQEVVCEKIMELMRERYKICVYIQFIQNQLYARVSAQIYNDREDYQKLAQAVLDVTKGHDSLVTLFSSLSVSC